MTLYQISTAETLQYNQFANRYRFNRTWFKFNLSQDILSRFTKIFF